MKESFSVLSKDSRTDITSLRKKANIYLNRYRSAVEIVRTEKKQLIEARRRIVHIEKAQQILQSVAQTVQQKAHRQVAEIVTQCLQTIFEVPYQFRIVFDKKRGKTEARLVLVLNGEELDPLEAEGGGVIDVAAFALRISALMLSKPPLRKLLILDEPFKFVEPTKRQKIGELIHKLSRRLKIQIILVTHDPELEIGKVIQL